MTQRALAERRLESRYPTQDMRVCVRAKGRLQKCNGVALDFNRHGLSLLLEHDLPLHKTIYVSIEAEGIKLQEIIAVVHSCVAWEDKFRCGLQFRTHSPLQMDQCLVEQTLMRLESQFRMPDAD